MKVRRFVGRVCIDLSAGEAHVLLDELSNVRGGARLPKLRRVCEELERSLTLVPVVGPIEKGESS